MMVKYFAFVLVYLLVAVKYVEATCGNHVCEPDRGERWDTCSFDCCKTDDCDKEHNNVNHAVPPQTEGHGGPVKRDVYRYHGPDGVQL
jgi:hypothetical protein